MSEPFIGEIQAFAFNQVPRGWAPCDGRVMQINQNQALYALLGTTYGGNGVTTFCLPNLVGRAPVHTGEGVTLGQQGGEVSHVLTTGEMPAHTHLISGTNANAGSFSPEGAIWAKNEQVAAYSTSAPDTTLSPAALAAAGNGQAHENMQPYLVLQYCIAVSGIFPTRN